MDNFYHRISKVEDTLLRAQTAPTFPKYAISVPSTPALVITLVLPDHGDTSHPFIIALNDNDANSGNGQELAAAIAIFGTSTLVERNPTSAITWTYAGGDTLSFSLSDPTRLNWWYQAFAANTTGGGFTHVRSDGSGNVSMAWGPGFSDLGSPIETDPTLYFSPFDARIQPSETGSNVFAEHFTQSFPLNDSRVTHANLFEVGTAGPISDPNTITYDGNETIVATIPSPISGHHYFLFASPQGYNVPNAYTISVVAP